MKVVILGMHRSGTSCAAQMLHAAGVHLGADLMECAAQNLDGFFESIEAMQINEEILTQSGGSWHSVPALLSAGPEVIERADRFLIGLAENPVAGWKDPRTVITYPVWRPLLGEHWILACLRNPEAVARSLSTREGWPMERGYRLWLDYNTRLAEHVRQHSQVLWFDYDRPPSQQQAWLRHACAMLGLTPTAEALAVFDRFQKHHPARPSADPDCEQLYQALRRQAAENWAIAADGSTDSNADESEDLEQAIAALQKIHGQHNLILQRLERRLHELNVHCHDMHTRLQHSELLHEQLQHLVVPWKEAAEAGWRRELHLDFQKLAGSFAAAQQVLTQEVATRTELCGGLAERINGLEQDLVEMKSMRLRVDQCHTFIERVRQTLPYRAARRMLSVARRVWRSPVWLTRPNQ